MKRFPTHALPSLRQWFSASSRASLPDHLHQELTSRRIPFIYDYLQPQQSHLLNLTLKDLFPKTELFQGKNALSTTLPSIASPPRLAPGHHLVYFPSQVTLSQLLPDGTDVLHSPGQPFNRRLWAGGRVRFTETGSGPLLDGSRAVCIETIRNVTSKGTGYEEKIFVSIERRIGIVGEGEDENSIRDRIWTEDEEQTGQASVIENRTLVFMRDKTREEVSNDKERFKDNDRAVRPPKNPIFRHSLTPSRALLFRFSALTFNAHLIHLDKAYTQEDEGYRNPLVHGPLIVVLLLSAIRANLSETRFIIREIEYRNLAPLYAEEELTICGKPKTGADTGAWEIWIENKQGGLAVRGTVRIE